MQPIYLPNIKKLTLENFSLYSVNPVVMDFSKSVSCIMGANGIGKSTLLNCINFALTGRINPPNKKLKSMDELESSNDYSLKYFDGRISETDKEFATSTITFSLNEKNITIKRSFFPNQILEYYLNEEKQDIDKFETDVVAFTRLNNYAQFVFLQLKVLTFDESRDCLFWNPSVLTPTIFLCLGKNVENANKADELARELQKLSSRIRNIQWEITKQNNRLTTLIEEKNAINNSVPQYSNQDEAYAKNEYEYVEHNLEQIETERNDLLNKQQFVYAKTSELTIEKLKLENEYQEIYSRLYAENIDLRKSPIIMELTGKCCPVCKSVHSVMPTYIEKRISKNICPLCGETVCKNDNKTNDILEVLQKKDEQLKEVSDKIVELTKKNVSITKRIEELNALTISLSLKREQIEQQNFKFLHNRSSDDSWGTRIKTLQESIRDIEKEKSEHIQKRDALKKEYDSLCLNLETVYQEVQTSFLPIFKKYAKKFTGLDLDMTLNSISDDGRRQFKLALQIDDTSRDNEFELSESQRFFIDIALRMTMVTFICSENNSCSMLIDTPEGSLDIAYETNAGTMFYEYVNDNQKMIITANLNSSGLIRTLAENTKTEKFELINMLKWAKLSLVQSHHLELFSTAITEIKNRLE